MSKRSRTVRSKRMVQAGAVVLIALAAAVFVLPVSRLLRPEPPKLSTTTRVDPGPDSTTESRFVDSSEMSRALALSNPRTDITPAATLTPDAPDESGTETTTDDPVVAQTSPGGWAYLGSVISPRNAYALLRTDSGQFYLQKGSKRDGRTLTEIHPDHVILKDDSGAETSISLLPPTVTWPERGPGRMNPTTGATAMGAPTAPGANLAVNAKPNGPLYGAGRPELFQARPTGVQPPIRTPPTVIVNSGEVSDPNFAHERLQELVGKVSAGDFDPDYVESMLREIGLPEGASVEEQVEMLGKMGVTPKTNPDFYKNLMEYNQSIGNTQGMKLDVSNEEREQVLRELQEQGLSPEEQMKVLEEKGLMQPETPEQREQRLKEEEAARQ